MTWPRWLDGLARDVRHAVRGLRRSPGLSATVVIVLALGIGANTAMFSIVYGLLLRPLPYPGGERIVRLGREPRGMPGAPVYLSAREIERVEEGAGSFEQIAAYGGFTFEWTSPDGSLPRGAPLSPALLRLLGATPQLGRFFTDGEARPGADGVVLLSHRAWVWRFGANPEVVGTVVTVNNERRAVVGVLAEGFYFPTPEEEVWIPYVLRPDEPTAIVLGRLRAGVPAERAATEVRAILQTMDGSPGVPRGAESGRAPGDSPPPVVRVIPLQEEMVGEYRPALAALTSVTALVLLIAFANVAGLLLARSVTRQRTLAVCAALGAGRGRLARQIVTECVVLSLGGGALGLVVASVVLRVVPALVPGNIMRLDEVGLDGAVFAFTMALSVSMGVGFGLVTALQGAGSDLVRTVVEGSVRAAGGFGLLRANRARAVLAAGQMALALALLVGAGLLLRSFVGLMTADRGYDATNVVTAGTRYATFRNDMAPQEFQGFIRRSYGDLADAMDSLSGLPQVAAAGVSSTVPLAGSGHVQQVVHVIGRPTTVEPNESPPVLLRVASPGYFDVLRLRLVSGRRFTRGDGAGAPRVLVVNETFARQVLAGEAAVGQRVRFTGIRSDDEPWAIVGVVEDVNYRGLALAGSVAEVFASVQQIDYVPTFAYNFAFVAMRTTGDSAAALPFLREAVAGARPGASVASVMSLDARLSAAVAEPRFYAVLVGGFAALAVFLAALGVYGLLSYTVAQRRGEIAIRMALGAHRGAVLALVMRQGAALVGMGAIVGLAAAAAGSRILQAFLFGVAADDPLTFVAAPLALIAAAFLACYVPARRATRIAPMEVLRSA